jgi:hypothetical protein
MAQTTRLATWIGVGVDHRLRLLAVVRRQQLGPLLTDLLDEALPSADVLAEQAREVPTNGR